MTRKFRATDYVGEVSTGVWSASWIITALVAIDRFVAFPDAPSWIGVVVAVGMSIIGCWITKGLLRTLPLVPCDLFNTLENHEGDQSWSRRINDWCGAVFVSGFSLIWIFGFTGTILLAAAEGRGWWMLFLIPWSIVTWLCLVLLFACIAVVIDFLLNLLVRSRL